MLTGAGGTTSTMNDKPTELRAQRRLAKPPRKHHYVPVFYQKKFTNSEGLLWVYDRQIGSYKQLHPDVICFKKDLYSVRHPGGEADTRMETQVLCLVDASGNSGMRELETNLNFSAEAAQQVAFFMAFQFTRLPSFNRAISAILENMAEEIARVTFANVERAKAVIARYTAETGKSVPVSAESMVEAIKGKHLRMVATKVPFLTNMVKQAETLSHVIIDLRWEILVAPADTGFIISDSPVAVVPPRGSNQVGFLIPGTIKYLPLNRNLCLRVSERGQFFRRRNIDKESVRIINLNVAANSERFIMAPDKAQLEAIVQRSGSAKPDATPRFIVKIVQSDEDGSLTKIEAQLRRYFYPKNGSSYPP